MSDLSAAKMFKSSAFEPSDKELTRAAKARGKRRISIEEDESTSDEDVIMATPPRTFTGSKLDLDDSSDEEMPDVADLFADREGKKKVKKDKVKKDKAPTTIEDVGLSFVLRDAF
jgi:hypothetical protein